MLAPGANRPRLLLAVYLLQVLLSGWLHLEPESTRCSECSERRGPQVAATCDGSVPCSLPTHHHHPTRQHQHDHLGCSLCSPLQTLPAGEPVALGHIERAGFVPTGVASDLTQPRLHSNHLARGPPAVPALAG